MSRLLACLLIPCASIPVRLDLCKSMRVAPWTWTCSPPATSIAASSMTAELDRSSRTSRLSAWVMVNSGLLTIDKATAGVDAGTDPVQSTGPQTVAFWHFAMHFLWQHMVHSWHCIASFNQIFLPQKSHWVARWKWVLTKLCARGTTIAVVDPKNAVVSDMELVNFMLIISDEGISVAPWSPPVDMFLKRYSSKGFGKNLWFLAYLAGEGDLDPPTMTLGFPIQEKLKRMSPKHKFGLNPDWLDSECILLLEILFINC